jgi:transposase-like protein
VDKLKDQKRSVGGQFTVVSCRPHLKPTNKSYRTDETYIKVKGEDKYLGIVAKTRERAIASSRLKMARVRSSAQTSRR